MRIMKNLVLIFFLNLFLTVLVFAETPNAKHIFLFIGDGMGLSEVNAAEAYQAAIDGKIGIKKLSFTQFPVLGIATTYAKDRYITDSAAAGTALATGNKTSVETIGMDASRKNALKNLTELAKERGMKTGVVSTANIDDATPATFYAHVPQRAMYKEIDEAFDNSSVDIFAGGGVKKMVKRSYMICTRLEKDKSCPFAIDSKNSDIKLSEFTRKVIDKLENPAGFFVMIEAGKIDWANHANDAATAIKEVLALDEAVKVAVDFYEEHPDDTLIVVTSDHETGGFAQGSRSMEYKSDLKKLNIQKVSGDTFDYDTRDYKNFSDVKPYLREKFGFWKKSGFEITPEDEEELEKAFLKRLNAKPGSNDVYALSSKVTRLLNSKVGLGWTTGSHTAMPVGVFAKGKGAELFKGYIDNTDVAKNIIKTMELK